jgi:hypothetical protein
MQWSTRSRHEQQLRRYLHNKAKKIQKPKVYTLSHKDQFHLKYEAKIASIVAKLVTRKCNYLIDQGQ